jgi:drug/metabolite transporter (DMT)-like permease
VPITLGALAFQEYPDLTALSTPALVSLAYVLAVPMVFCHWAWFTVVRLFPAAIAAIGTLAIPVVGVLSSALVLGEPVGLRELTALGLVCGALAVVLVLPALGRART